MADFFVFLAGFMVSAAAIALGVSKDLFDRWALPSLERQRIGKYHVSRFYGTDYRVLRLSYGIAGAVAMAVLIAGVIARLI